LKLLGVAIILFASTNLDDILVLVGFFANPGFRSKNIVVGQYVGISVLFTVSAVGALLALVIPRPYMGMLGIIPILVGAKNLLAVHQKQISPESRFDRSRRPHTQIAAVALVTIANGGDNVGLCVPEFAIRSWAEITFFAAVFAFMTALWCFVAHWLVHHPTIGRSIRRYGAIGSSLVLICIGVSILYEAGSLRLLTHVLVR
jgi:cadmium resistance protein CadD (predicted permease)